MEFVEVQDVQVPALGSGTWQLGGEACREGVHHALELGYRHIDTAQMYRNEAEVGAGIADSDADRDEVVLHHPSYDVPLDETLEAVRDQQDAGGVPPTTWASASSTCKAWSRPPSMWRS